MAMQMLLPLMTGLMQGQAAKKKRERTEAMEDAQMKLQQALFGLKKSEQNVKLAELRNQQSVLQMLMQDKQTKNAASVQNATATAQRISPMEQAMQAGGMDIGPRSPQFGESLTGPQTAGGGQGGGGGMPFSPEDMPLLAAMGMPQIATAINQYYTRQQGNERNDLTRQNNTFNQLMKMVQFMRGYQEGQFVTLFDADGNEVKVRMPKYGANTPPLALPGAGGNGATEASGGMTMGGLPAFPGKKAEKNRAIPSADIPYWVNPDTLEKAKPGDTPVDLEARGFYKIPTTELTRFNDIVLVDNVLDKVERMMRDTVPESGTRLEGALRSGQAWAQFGDQGQKLAVMRDFISQNKTKVAKALGAVGNLTENEQKDAEIAFGSLADAGGKAWMQFRLLRETFEDAKNVMFGRTSSPKAGGVIEWEIGPDGQLKRK
jgi:hypothetical protein